MGCAGCLPDAKEQQAQKELIRKKAKQDAVKLQKLMVLYINAEREVCYMEAEAARNSCIQPIEFVSHLLETNDG